MSYRPIGEPVDEALGVITMLRAEGAIAVLRPIKVKQD